MTGCHSLYHLQLFLTERMKPAITRMAGLGSITNSAGQELLAQFSCRRNSSRHWQPTPWNR